MHDQTIRILSIDGGGIRGVIPAVVLARLERMTGRPVADLFDLIAGTSTGGILALGLTCPDTAGRPRYTAERLIDLYQKEGGRIFATSWWRKLRTLGSLAEEKYPAEGIEAVLRQYFGGTRLKDALVDLLVPSYEIERREPFFFRSAAARAHAEYDFPMWQVARATSAAPTYFEPARVPFANGSDYWALIDGGMFANNPAACALVEARRYYPEAKRFLVVSLGTGNLQPRLAIDRARNWGAARWARPALEIVLDGVSATVDYQLKRIIPDDYLRIQLALQPGGTAMDNSSPDFVRGLRLQAEALCQARAEDLQRIARRLVHPGDEPDELPRAA